ncbi:helix-turn-helix domain-containing protein [Actinobacillus pleuropneumoniae]|uniref:helix-turn-helix domain-containing protein n=1 Tax=Actinobacillus pleuropneumoniae TaxID=715 RepID=UPI003B02C81F
MGNYNNSVICSYQTLMEITGYSRPTVARAIKHLKDNRWIDTVKLAVRPHIVSMLKSLGDTQTTKNIMQSSHLRFVATFNRKP